MHLCQRRRISRKQEAELTSGDPETGVSIFLPFAALSSRSPSVNQNEVLSTRTWDADDVTFELTAPGMGERETRKTHADNKRWGSGIEMEML